MTAAIVAALIACGLVALGAAIGWALHADNLRRHPATLAPNRGHVRRRP